MRKNSLFLKLTVMAALLLLNVAFAFAANEQVMKVGKKGAVVFEQATQLGDVTLPPGNYIFQHRASGNDHFIKFVGAKEMEHANTAMLGTTMQRPTTSGAIKCRVEPLNHKVTQTAIYIDTASGVRRITRIEIAGENVAHVF